MKLLEIEELSPAEITEQVKKSRLELVELRLKLASRQLENLTLIRKKRKEIARLLTVQTGKLAHGEDDKKGARKEVQSVKQDKKKTKSLVKKSSEGLSEIDKPSRQKREDAKKAK